MEPSVHLGAVGSSIKPTIAINFQRLYPPLYMRLFALCHPCAVYSTPSNTLMVLR